MYEDPSAVAQSRGWGGHRSRPASAFALRVNARALAVAPILYLAGAVVTGVLAATFLVSWLVGVLVFALIVAAWTTLDASERGIAIPHGWGLAAGFIPLAGIALYMMRREAQPHAV